MGNAVLYTACIIAVLAVIIIGFELYDSRMSRMNQQVRQEGIYCTGRITKIRRRRTPPDPKIAGNWDVQITFEYEGNAYSVELHPVAQPMLEVGSKISVCVNTKDPWKSIVKL